jgi:hypothetical protein
MVDSVHDLVAEYPSLEALRVWFLRLAEAVAVLLQACEKAGEVRPGLEAADVLLLMGFLWSRAAGDAGEQQVRRVLDLAISGLQ